MATTHGPLNSLLGASLLLGCLLPASLGAAEKPVLDEVLVSLYRQAGTEHDLWTMLQIEAYAARTDLRMRGPLGDLRVYGDPLFANPRQIIGVIDRGPRIHLIDYERIHTIASDGRPLAPAIPLQTTPSLWQASPDGRFIGILRAYFDEDRQEYRLYGAVYDTDLRREDWDFRFTLTAEHDLNDHFALADDGSALALYTRGLREVPDSQSRTWLITKRGETAIEDLRRPHAVGTDGAWLIAQKHAQTVYRDESTSTPLLAWATGPEGRLAVVQSDGQLVLRGPAGTSDRPCPLPHDTDLTLLTCGPWLALSHNQRTDLEEFDIFGNTTTVRHLGRCLLYDWRAFEDSAPTALLRATGRLYRDQHHPEALLFADTQQLTRLQPRESEPFSTTTLVRASGGLQRFQQLDTGYSYDDNENQRHILRPDGQEIWAGAPVSYAPLGADRLLQYGPVTDDQPLPPHLILGAPEAEKRSAIALDSQLHDLEVGYDIYGHGVFLFNTAEVDDPQPTIEHFDLADGHLLGRRRSDEPFNRSRQEVDYAAPSGYGSYEARLLAKDPSQPPGLARQFNDALHHPKGIVAMCTNGDLVLFDKRNGALELLHQTQTRYLQLMALGKRPEVYVVNRHHVLGKIDSRGHWQEAQPDTRRPDPDDREGSWRVTRRNDFMMPRYGSARWPRTLARPLRLRSHDAASSLLIVYRTAIIECEAREMKKLLELFDRQ